MKINPRNIWTLIKGDVGDITTIQNYIATHGQKHFLGAEVSIQKKNKKEYIRTGY